MLFSPAFFYGTILAGLAAAVAALTLRRAEALVPAPGDIAARGGLGAMLVGVFAWLAIVSIGTVSVVAAGIVLPLAVALALALGARYANYGAALAPFYRFQLALAVLALIAALVLWFQFILLLQGVPHA